jgi:hypothetical protein
MSRGVPKPRLFVLGMQSDEELDFRRHLWAGYEPGGAPGLYVTLPSYSEGGETLSRSAEALAMQVRALCFWIRPDSVVCPVVNTFVDSSFLP